MKKPVTWKEIFVWTAIAILPGGTLILAYQLGRDHRKIVAFFNNQLKKLRNV